MMRSGNLLNLMMAGAATVCLLMHTGCASGRTQTGARLLVNLPESCHTPDGCCLDAEGNIILSVPNFSNAALIREGIIDQEYPARMMKIDKNNTLSIWYAFKPEDLHPVTGKTGPMDCAFGPDGNLYVADNQIFNEPQTHSRLLRILVRNGKAERCDVVAEGFGLANGVAWKDGTVYVSDTVLGKTDDGRSISGVWAIPMSDWKDGPIRLKAYNEDDPDSRLIAVYESSGRVGFGADGLAFDDDGNLYCSIFEDGIFYKTSFDAQGHPSEPVLFFPRQSRMQSADGIVYSSEDACFYAADMLQNSVHKVDLKGRITTVHSNGDTDGSDGALDQPCEVLLRGRELIVVNMDMWWDSDLLVNRKIDQPFTVSVIDLK